MQNNEQSLSVLCADIRSSAPFPGEIDKAEALYTFGRYENRIRRSVESQGGQLVNRSGGKVMAFFSDGVAALKSAIEMKHRVAELPPNTTLPLTVRVGLCTGHQSKEERYFPREGSNPAASLAEIAEPEHILLSIPKRVTLLPGMPPASDSVPDLALNCGKRRLGVFRVGWQENDQAALQMALSQLGNWFGQLRLRYNGKEIVLDNKKAVLRIGRQMDCDFRLQDPRTSRLHGTIERRHDRFVFVDRSSNGTFVTFENQNEFFVHRNELVLFGKGQLSLGASSSALGVELIKFQTSDHP
jgi:adenylate cyclase